jgi:hypothetical protein
VICLLAASAAAALAEEAPSFRRAEWRARQGKWRFEPGGELRCEGGTTSSLLYRRGFSARDLEVAVEVMFLGPGSSAGIFFRADGAKFYGETTFYQLEWYTEGRHHGKRLSLMIKKERSWQQIVTPVFRAPSYNRWIAFRLRAQGELIQAFVDGERVFEKRDRAYLRPGALGLHVFQPREVRFRRFQLKALTPDRGS